MITCNVSLNILNVEKSKLFSLLDSSCRHRLTPEEESLVEGCITTINWIINGIDSPSEKFQYLYELNG